MLSATGPTSPEAAPDPLPSARLFYRDGSSDKVYHAGINAVGDGYTVTFASGRRGSALTAGTKTAALVAWEKARQIYDKLLAEKTAKGYTTDGAGALFALTDYERRWSGLHPQLLNSIGEEADEALLADPAWRPAPTARGCASRWPRRSAMRLPPCRTASWTASCWVTRMSSSIC